MYKQTSKTRDRRIKQRDMVLISKRKKRLQEINKGVNKFSTAWLTKYFAIFKKDLNRSKKILVLIYW
jgi:hypothetical protein